MRNIICTQFSEININDSIFDIIKKDYPNFDKWFEKKSKEDCYCFYNEAQLIAFLYLKEEFFDENYNDIYPTLKPEHRLKIGTFFVSETGKGIGSELIEFTINRAKELKCYDIYVTIYNNSIEKQRFIEFIQGFSFKYHGKKDREEVYVLNCKDFKL